MSTNIQTKTSVLKYINSNVRRSDFTVVSGEYSKKEILSTTKIE